ncbi:hypothetical protein LC040_04190 [Bacillus tianshenii]|nr:hypothetical protein LC040_04190 [Bacillus tianshenii]
MFFTCKKCCTVMRETLICTVCGNEENVVPINIQLQGNVITYPTPEQRPD